MDKLTFRDTYDLSCFMMGVLEEVPEHGNVTAVLQYGRAKDLLFAFVTHFGVNSECIDLAPQYVNGYNGEYYVTLDDDMNVWIEPAIQDGVVLWHDSDAILYEEGTNRRIITKNEDSNARRYMVAWGYPYEDSALCTWNDCSEDCTDCQRSRNLYD